MLREHGAKKSFKPGGCESLVKEVMSELRSWVKMLILGEQSEQRL